MKNTAKYTNGMAFLPLCGAAYMMKTIDYKKFKKYTVYLKLKKDLWSI